jgi:hypothetical protein
MSIVQEPTAELSGPNGGGPFSGRKLAIWLPGIIIIGLVVAWGAVEAQFYFAPLVIFPVMVGIGLGALLIGLMRSGQVGHRPTIIIGTILAGMIAAAGQHYFIYYSAKKSVQNQAPIIKQAQETFPEFMGDRLHAPPAGFIDYMSQQAARGRPLLFNYAASGLMAWISWAMDGLLVLMGAMAVVIPAMLLPFCGRCQSWYRAIRSAHVSDSTLNHIGQMVGVEEVEHLKSGRCRLICCQSGCGPTGCELYWEDTSGDTFFARVWMGAADRNRVMHALDEDSSLRSE